LIIFNFYVTFPSNYPVLGESYLEAGILRDFPILEPFFLSFFPFPSVASLYLFPPLEIGLHHFLFYGPLWLTLTPARALPGFKILPSPLPTNEPGLFSNPSKF